MEKQKSIRAVIVGAGHRSLLYASYALNHPNELKIVGVVDPNLFRRNQAAKIHHIEPKFCFNTVEEFVAQPKFADAVINGTMDQLHVATTIPILEAGYDVLLEKPISVNKADLLGLYEAVNRTQRTVMICHVLRYAPFYKEIRERVAAGEIGDVLTMTMQENVSYHHLAVSYIRGKWSQIKESYSTLLMAKSCHDLDLMTWMKSGVKPISVSSFANLMYFKKENAPEGAGKRCLVDCHIEKDCVYSAYKTYIEQDLWSFYVWDDIEHIGPNITLNQKIESLKKSNPYGRCVWQCDNDVADHQSVIVEFEDGCIANHTINGNTAKPNRYIHLVGTKGEIEGYLEDGSFIVRHLNMNNNHQFTEKVISIDVKNDMHGGGDLHLVADFVAVLRHKKPSISTTTIEDSINGHLIGFAANEANEQKTVIKLI